MGGHGEQEGVGEGQGMVEVGAKRVRWSRAWCSMKLRGWGPPPWVNHGSPSCWRLLDILLQLFQVPLVLRSAVLEPADHLQGNVGYFGWHCNYTVLQDHSVPNTNTNADIHIEEGTLTTNVQHLCIVWHQIDCSFRKALLG